MSKIIEALKTRSIQMPKDGFTENRPKEFRIEKTAQDLTQQQLADIYFSATGKSKSAEPPVIIRVVETPKIASYIPWLIASLAFFVTILALFSSKRVMVDVKVFDEKSIRWQESAYDREEASALTRPAAESTAQALTANKLSAQEFAFEGAAYLNSSKDKDGTLTLINSSVAPFARASLIFDPPLDLSRARLIFYAKGGRGGETVAVALKDAENVQGFYKGKLFPFPDRLSTSWQKADIGLQEETAKDFDASHITSLRFEFGSKDTGNKPGDTVMIKDLQWVTS